MAKQDNMELWNSVEVTDPKYTKKVNQRGGFTAIGAQYQLMRATETFGPIGYGWGVKNEKIEQWHDVGLAVYTAILWYVRDGIAEEHEIPIHSSIKYHSNGRVDDDFFKKVATDALTKGLSKIGFNADVFMGKFDDNKYINKLTNMDGTWKKEVLDATKGLNDKDKNSILSFIKEGKVTLRNYKKALERIESMKVDYENLATKKTNKT